MLNIQEFIKLRDAPAVTLPEKIFQLIRKNSEDILEGKFGKRSPWKAC
jgi:hypothetical protein